MFIVSRSVQKEKKKSKLNTVKDLKVSFGLYIFPVSLSVRIFVCCGWSLLICVVKWSWRCTSSCVILWLFRLPIMNRVFRTGVCVNVRSHNWWISLLLLFNRFSYVWWIMRLLSNLLCEGLYVSNWARNEVRRWKIGDTHGTIVA
jgi:hypothetical protein